MNLNCLTMISLILIFNILIASLSSNKHAPSVLWLTRLSSIAIIFSGFLIINVYYIDRLYEGLSLFSGFINVNSINQTFHVLILLLSGIILGAVLPSIKNLSFVNNYVLIILFNIIGAICLSSAGDLITLYIAIETQSFSLYILSALKNDSPNSASAGLHYFLTGSLASTIILLGIALIYYATGLTNFESLYVYFNITDWFGLDGFSGGFMLPESAYSHSMSYFNFSKFNSYYSVAIFGVILVITGVFIKIGAAPFHQWSLEVYPSVPTIVTTWLVILPKISLFVLLFQFLELFIGNGSSMLYSSAYANILDWMGEGVVQEHIIYLTNGNILNLDYFTQMLNNFYYDEFLLKLQQIYGDVTQFYPHYLQVELLNTINSPIINQGNYNFITPHAGVNFDNYISSLWTSYTADMHNSLYYTINITPLSSITIKNYLILISVFSLIIGAIGGLYQINIKRLLAFSAINQTGFIILALAVNNVVGFQSFLFYLFQYSLINLNLFLILIALGLTYYSSDLLKSTEKNGLVEQEIIRYKNKEFSSDIKFLNQLKGFFNINSILALSFIVSLFSFAGIPPFPGFFAKQQVLLSALSLGFIFVSVVAIITSVISAAYYLNLIKNSTVKGTHLFNYIKYLANPTASFIAVNTGISNPKESSSIKKNTNFESFFNKSSILLIQPTNYHLRLKISAVLSYTISLLTLSMLFFIFKSDLCNNSFSILTMYLYSL